MQTQTLQPIGLSLLSELVNITANLKSIAVGFARRIDTPSTAGMCGTGMNCGGGGGSCGTGMNCGGGGGRCGTGMNCSGS